MNADDAGGAASPEKGAGDIDSPGTAVGDSVSAETVVGDAAGSGASAEAVDVPDEVDPDEALKAKYRAALAHKHDGSGASGQGHSDSGHPDHPHGAAAQQRMFRRRAGG